MNVLLRWRRPSCFKVRQVLQQFLDGELGPDDAEFVAAHLAECDRCSVEAEIYEQVKQSLVALRPRPDQQALARLVAEAERILAAPDAD
ncbi:MAG TPA: zf-HC2 domain-containing protein [Nitriliruptoraceae bacterium]|nr:zf-HC2 domain-containing protein [Nitriliruptoraceae bacterium]